MGDNRTQSNWTPHPAYMPVENQKEKYPTKLPLRKGEDNARKKAYKEKPLPPWMYT